MKEKIIRGITGIAAAVLAVISVNESVYATQMCHWDGSYATSSHGQNSFDAKIVPWDATSDFSNENTVYELSNDSSQWTLFENEDQADKIVPTDKIDQTDEIDQINENSVQVGAVELHNTDNIYDPGIVGKTETEYVSEGIHTLNETASSALDAILEKKDIMAVVYLTDECKVYCEPDTDSEIITHIPEGETVYISGAAFTENMGAMYRISAFVDGTEYAGYVEAKNLIYSDEDLKNWADEYLTGTGIVADALSAKAAEETLNTDYAAEGTSLFSTTYEEIDRFPYSYRAKLTALKSAHPNWFFVPMNTGLDFNTAVSNEMGDKSWIYINDSNTANGWVGNATGQGKWAYATQAGVQFHMDPRNSLTDSYIFQFEQLTFNKSYHTVEAIQSFLNGTFMKGSLPDGSMTFADAFYQIGSSQGVSPIHLASRVYQEQGRGTSPLISGTYSGYEGYYNYFNVGATGKTDAEVIKNGLEYARKQGWNTPYKALTGGAATIGNGYIKKGQDTGYLEKFNVNPNASHALYTHQYMQNIQAPRSESSSTKTMYANAGCLDSSFVFKIPVFNNMGGDVEPKPITSFKLKGT